MALRPPRPRRARRLVRVALATGAATLVAVVAVIAFSLTRGPRPEEQVAERFLTALLQGEGGAAYALTTPEYRAVVFERDLDAIADALADVAGTGAALTILGSERTVPEPVTPESLVGYQAITDVGRIEGVVTLEQQPDDGWAVREVSHRFPGADPEDVAEVQELLRRLNQQVTQRVSG
ncbi:MAG: hypothetical protein KY469_00525 [Actinobacteria bacterium]|nr:hypothetical protein [Actinomycetota bacterium]